MLKKITSILVILILLGSNSLAMIHVDNCDMPCCQEETTCCSMEQMIIDCEQSMAACDMAVIVPIVVAPINIFEQQIEINMDILVSTPVAPAMENLSYDNLLKNDSLAEPPPSYNSPLLI